MLDSCLRTCPSACPRRCIEPPLTRAALAPGHTGIFELGAVCGQRFRAWALRLIRPIHPISALAGVRIWASPLAPPVLKCEMGMVAHLLRP